MSRFSTLFWGALFSLSIAACGGGGGGGGETAPNYSITVDKTSVTFTAVLPSSAAPAAQTLNVSFVGDGLIVGYPPGVPVPTWLDIQAPPQTGNSPAQVSLRIQNIASTPPGAYSTTLRLVTGKADGSVVKHQDVAVNYSVYEQVATSTNSLTFYAIQGDANLNDAQMVTVLAPFGTEPLNWTATVTAPWLSLDNTVGQGAGNISVKADPSSIAAAGHYTAEIKLKNVNVTETISIPVDVYVDSHRIRATDHGLLLTKASNYARLNQQVLISQNGRSAGTWTASSDQPWLTVSATGSTGDMLNVSADPSGLASEGQFFATVTVNSVMQGEASADTIRVGLYVTAAEVNADLILAQRPVSAVDPVRPLLYSEINPGLLTVTNIMTGADEGIIDIGGQWSEAYAIADDGSELFFTRPLTSTLHALSLNDSAHTVRLVATLPEVTLSDSIRSRIAYGKTFNRAVIYTSSGRLLEADTGLTLTPLNTNFNTDRPLAYGFSGDGKWLFLGPTPGHNGSMQLAVIDHLRSGAPISLLEKSTYWDGIHTGFSANYSEPVFVNATGSMLYGSGNRHSYPLAQTPSGAQRLGCSLFTDTDDHQLHLVSDGDRLTGVDLLDRNDAVLGHHALTGVIDSCGEFAVSGDSGRYIVRTGSGLNLPEPALIIRNLP